MLVTVPDARPYVRMIIERLFPTLGALPCRDRQGATDIRTRHDFVGHFSGWFFVRPHHRLRRSPPRFAGRSSGEAGRDADPPLLAGGGGPEGRRGRKLPSGRWITSVTVPLDAWVIAAFAFCRIGGCFMLMPGLSSARVPMQVRLFVAVAASFEPARAPSTRSIHVDRMESILVPMVVSELLVGGLIGMLARIYVLALQFAGSAIAMLIGYGGTSGPGVEDGEPQVQLGALISFSALLLLFVFDFHHEVIRALVASYQVTAPLDVVFNPQSALVDITDTLSEFFLVVLRLASPFVAYALRWSTRPGRSTSWCRRSCSFHPRPSSSRAA